MSEEIPGLPLPLTGATRVYVIIGDPIAQAGSPLLFNAAFRRLGLEAVLIPLHVSPEGLGSLLSGLRQMRNLDGIVVTVPHKMSVLNHIDQVGVSAQRIGAVNAIKCRADGVWVGDNFDGKGCIGGLQADGHTVAGRRVLLVGAGGAGSAVAHAMADAGAGHLRISDVDVARKDRLAGSLRTAHPQLSLDTGSNDPGGFDVVMNCTPLGMKADDPYPIEPDAISPDTLVIDVILKPHRSPLLDAAAARGCPTQPGKRMLEGQVQAVLDFFSSQD